MKLGLVTYNLAEDWDVETIIKNCQATGFQGVELRTTHAHGVEPTLSSHERKEVRRKFEGSGVVLCGLGTAFEYHSTDPDEVQRNIDGTKQFVLLAKDLGVSGIKVRPNGVNTDKGVPLEKALEQIGRAARQCADFAAGEGVQIRMEVHGHVTSQIPNMKKIANHADHPNFYICWNCNDGETINGSIKANFDLFKDKIALVHIQDLGDPRYPWQELVSLLKANQYNGFCCAEIQPIDQPVRLMQYYSALWQAYLRLTTV